jgi:hypothetical protein
VGGEVAGQQQHVGRPVEPGDRLGDVLAVVRVAVHVAGGGDAHARGRGVVGGSRGGRDVDHPVDVAIERVGAHTGAATRARSPGNR